jgi:CRISPR-associated protein Csd2
VGIGRSSARASKKLDQVLKVYACHDHQHAIAILTIDYPDLLSEICDVLLAFRISIDFIKKAGGDESEIPKALSRQLRPLGWKEQKLHIELNAGGRTCRTDTHKIDYVKGKVAFDLESNSKDQTFDRDLYAFGHSIQKTTAAKVTLMRRKPEILRSYREVVVSDRKSRWQHLDSPTLVMWPKRARVSANDRNISLRYLA